ncbi:MAG: hypothetical protein FWC10_04405 [Lentimicrobiaceae bacterium]|nr:hypothetical protein [Lentimicrobiaceae bacterium]
MNFRASFCDPFKPDIIEIGNIEKESIMQLFEKIPWSEYLTKMKTAKENDIYYSPSLEIENKDNRNGLSISAIDGIEWCIFYKRPKSVKEEKEKQREEYEIKCFIREKMQSGKKEEQIIEALKIEKNINREDAISLIDRLNNSDRDAPNSNNIVWGIICFVGGGSLTLISLVVNNDKGTASAAIAIMLFGAFRLLRGFFGKISKKNKSKQFEKMDNDFLTDVQGQTEKDVRNCLEALVRNDLQFLEGKIR